MTKQEAKDTIARRHNQPDWGRLMSNTNSINKIERIMDKVLELYARSKWEEACYGQESNARIYWRGEGEDLTEPYILFDRPQFKP